MAAPNIAAVISAPASPIQQPETLRPLYPVAQPRRSHVLEADGGHRLHAFEFGRADGLPALVLHGGPGSGCSPLLHRFFDPQRFRIICPDQRGAGRSRPAGGTAHNTTAHLLADLRRWREHLGVQRWLVVGGSWGASLALAHAGDAPEAVAGLLLRASFLAREEDIRGFFQGERSPSPSAWRAFAERVPPAERGDMLGFLARSLAGSTVTAPEAAARAWWRWEQVMAGAGGTDASPAPAPVGPALEALVSRYRVQAHYLRHRCWLDEPPLLARCAALPPLPVRLLHGTEDRVCPPDGAEALQRALPGSHLHWVAGAGHDPSHPGMIGAMVDALRRFAEDAAA